MPYISLYYNAIAIAIANPLLANPVVLCATFSHVDPFHTRMIFDDVLKYKSPVVKASPSLSTEGSLDFAPR